MSSTIRRHRKNFSKFVQEQCDPRFEATLGELNKLWPKWNVRFFDGRMVVPYILFSEPTHSHRWGQYSSTSSFGAGPEIRIRPSLVWGDHPAVRPERQFERGRRLVFADVLLHEMVHQWQHEVVGEREETQAGHGPLFRDKCNDIGRKLQLPPVRTAKARGRDSDLDARWRGRPLRAVATVVDVSGHTRTAAGLRVKAKLDTRRYATGIVVTRAERQSLALHRHAFHGDWNYELRPRPS